MFSRCPRSEGNEGDNRQTQELIVLHMYGDIYRLWVVNLFFAGTTAHTQNSLYSICDSGISDSGKPLAMVFMSSVLRRKP